METEGVSYLFDSTSSLPPILEDELFYSWCARYHRLSSNVGARETSRQLFGHPSAALQADFPTRLDAFVTRTQGFIGDPLAIVFKHTKYPAFAPFIDANRRHLIIRSMSGQGVDYIKSRLGVQTSRISIAHPLRACPECISEELGKRHFSMWHVSHQLPGTFLCPDHLIPLWTLGNERRNESLRKSFIFPESIENTDWLRPLFLTDKQQDLLTDLLYWSRCTIATTASSPQFDTEALTDSYLLRLLELGFIGIDGRVRLNELCGAFGVRYAPLANIPGLEFVSGSNQDLMSILGSLLHSSPGVQHPLKHLLLMGLAYESFEQFSDIYNSISATHRKDRRSPLTATLCTLRKELRHLVIKEQISVNQAAQRLGLSVTQAIKYLEQEAIVFERRPRVVGTNLESKLTSLLKLGEERNLIERTLGLKVGFIKAYLARRHALRVNWEVARLTRRRKEYREKFLAVLDQYPDLPMKKIRRIPDNGFQWLYNNDRDWLSENLPSLWQRQ